MGNQMSKNQGMPNSVILVGYPTELGGNVNRMYGNVNCAGVSKTKF